MSFTFFFLFTDKMQIDPIKAEWDVKIMIEMLRLDFRLIHGQTGVYWTAKLGCDCILIVSDTLLQDPIKLATVKLSKPSGVKLVIKNVEDSIRAIKSGVTDKYHMFILTEKLAYAKRLMDGCDIRRLNLGGIMPSETSHHKLNDAVYCTPEEIVMLKEMMQKGYYLYLQQVPSENEVPLSAILK